MLPMKAAMACIIGIFAMSTTCLLYLSGAKADQSSSTQLLQQLRRQLEYPKVLDVWNNVDNLCFTQPSASVAVTCNDSETVTELKIIGDRLARPSKFDGHSITNMTLSEGFNIDSFVTTLTRLTTLRSVILASLGIWGPMPDKIHRLYSLEVLDMSSNFIYGPIPSKLSAMTKLQMLALQENYFNGPVPDWLDAFSNLTVLHLQKNQLSGPVPSSFGNLTAVSELALAGNNVIGNLPDMSRLNRLEMLDLRDNRLDSQLPRMPNTVVTVLLSNNSFTGQIPEHFSELTQIQHLDLSYNFLEGIPPIGIFSLPNISYLNLGSNKLSGALPGRINCSNSLGFVDLSSNRLTGDLPSCLNVDSNSRIVKISGNCLNANIKNQSDKVNCKSDMSANASKNKDVGLMVAAIGGIGFLVLLLMIWLLVSCRKNCQKVVSEQITIPKSAPDSLTSGLSSELLANARCISQSVKLGTHILPTHRIFSLDELREATKNFERAAYLGEGSVGKLYKGRLENGTFVAIRCLALFKRDSIRNLKLRLDLLAKLRHPNLVCLLGHCIDGTVDDLRVKRVFLIYEYVPNGTLHAYLSGASCDYNSNNSERPLTWSDRLQVLIGIAKAVHYLHTGIIPGSIYNRLRTRNILLDGHHLAKLSDYGLSIITDEIYKNKGITDDQRIFGSGLVVDETDDDVFDFGCIILEVLMGPKLNGNRKPFTSVELISSLSSPEDRVQFVDPVVLSTSSPESLPIVISITTKCFSPEPSSRPSIEEVLWNLQYADQVQATADGEQRPEASTQL